MFELVGWYRFTCDYLHLAFGGSHLLHSQQYSNNNKVACDDVELLDENPRNRIQISESGAIIRSSMANVWSKRAVHVPLLLYFIEGS